jgi:hypothetical protein
LRDRGFRGGRIAPHRAMIGLEVSWTLLVDLLVLPVLFATFTLAFIDPLMSGWREFFDAVREPLGLPGLTATRVFEVGPLAVAIPYFTAGTYWPEARDLQTGWLVTVLLFAVSFFLNGRLTPVKYFLRFLSIIQLTAQLWFTFMHPPFTYDLPVYVSGLLVCGVVILVLSPFLVAFTFHIFDFLLWQKFAMGALLLGHLAVLLPLQAAVHTWVIYRGSLLAMPMMFLVFGVLLDVFVYVALYGWGMSWRSGGVLDATDRRPPTTPARYPDSRPRPTPTPGSVRAITPIGTQVVRALSVGGLLWRRLGFGGRA